MNSATHPVHASGQYLIGGDLPVYRLGYGTMQLTGPGHWYHPADPDAAKALLRRAVELGINHLDTADAYGPETVEHLIRKALHPYPSGLVIATKGGLTRPGPNRWEPVGRPAYLRQCIEMSLRRLAVDRIDLYYLHRVDPLVRWPTSSAYSPKPSGRARSATSACRKSPSPRSRSRPDRADRGRAEPLQRQRRRRRRADLLRPARHRVRALPPLAAGTLAGGEQAPGDTATAAQAAISYLLSKSPNVLPIPGTSDPRHLEDNTSAASARTQQRTGS